MRIGVGLIVKNEQDDLPRALKSVENIVDKVYIVDTGSTDNTPQVYLDWIRNGKFQMNVSTYTDASLEKDGEWYLQDFSKARNQFVDRIDKECDVLLWLDADDELLDAKLLLEEIKKPGWDLISCTILHGGMQFRSHRVWRTNGGIRFEGACHEYPKWSPNLVTKCVDVRIKHHQSSISTQEPSDSRNLRILQAEYESGNREPRTLFYYANSLKDIGCFEEAVSIYQEYLGVSDWDEERARARLYTGRCLRALGRIEAAKLDLLYSMSLYPQYSELAMELSYIYFDQKDYFRAIGTAYMAYQNVPKSVLFIETNKYKEEPLKMINKCRELLDDVVN